MDILDRYAKLSRKEMISFAVAGFGQNMIINFVVTFMLVYLYEGVGFSAAGVAALTVILTITKIWDAVNDIMMGVIVDRTRTRWGKLRPYIIFTALPIAILTTMLFTVPDMKEVYMLIYIGVVYLLWDMLYTMSDVPYWGLAGAITQDDSERTKVISLSRTAGTLAAALTILSGPHLARLLSFSDKTTSRGWSYAAILISFVGMGLFTLAFFNTRERVDYSPERVTLKETFRLIFKNKPLFLILLGSTIGFARNMLSVGGAVVAVIVYGDEGIFTLLGAGIIGGLIIATILAPVILKFISKKKLMIYSTILTAIMYILMYLFSYHNIWIVFTMILLTGITSGFFIVIQTTMIADSVDYSEYQTGERSEGVCFAGLTFVSKLMTALATLAFGICVSLVGYEEGVIITETMKDGIFLGITIIPAISCLLSIIPFLFYDLSDDKLALLKQECNKKDNQ